MMWKIMREASDLKSTRDKLVNIESVELFQKVKSVFYTHRFYKLTDILCFIDI